ncbi:hypothetical protein K439DRAFT_1330028, partial [Ramaria rubella]
QERLRALNFLLEKSSVYTTLLGQRMNQTNQLHISSKDSASDVLTGSKRGRDGISEDVDDENDGVVKRLKMDEEERPESPSHFKQPDAITGATLKDYQLVGVEWLTSLWVNGVNGILADEMGLGCTLQTIAFLAHVRQVGVRKPALIVCPLSVLHNWADEFAKFAPSIPICMYHGTPSERTELRRTKMKIHEGDISSPRKKAELYGKQATGDPSTGSAPLRRSTRYPTRTSIPSNHGQPRPSVADNNEDDKEDEQYTEQAVDNKADDEDIFPIVLTTYEMIIKDSKYLSKYPWNFIVVDEGHRLKNMDCKLMQEIKKYDSANRLILTGTPLHNNLAELWSLLNFILPDIFTDLDSFQEWFNLPTLQSTLPNEQSKHVISKLHGILKPFLLRRLKADVEHSLPPKKEYVLYAPLSERQRGVYDAVLTGVLRSYLINGKQDEDAKNHRAKQLAAKSRQSRKWRKAIFRVKDDGESLYDELNVVEESTTARDVREEELDLGRQFHYKNTVVKQVNSMKLQNTVMQLRKVCSHPFLFDWPSDPVTRELVVDEQLVNASGKMMVLDRLLSELFDRGHKVLLFSQFTTMLDIIEEWADSFKAWNTCRIDGSTGPMERRTEMNRFQNGGDAPDAPRLFLLSTRAGGLGINLTAADTVIFYDQDWNPQMDIQAQDRAHRIGQTKPVLIFRLVSAHTVETRIMQRANEKRQLEALVIAKGKFRMPGSTSRAKESIAEAAASLLRLEGEKIEVVPSSEAGKAKIISDADLEKLLDRSPEVFAVRGKGWTSGAKAPEGNQAKTGDVAFEVFQAPVDQCNDGLAAMMGEKIE